MKEAADFNAKAWASRMRDVLGDIPPEWKVTATMDRMLNPDFGWFPYAAVRIRVAPVIRI